jgi:AmmeMemoRadiSam system protein A
MNADAARVLFPLARAAIARELGLEPPPAPEADWLREPGACFVTLKHGGALRGGTGTLRAHRALADDVRANAVAAAFRDPRFRPLTVEEFGAVALEIDLLTPLEPLQGSSERDVLARLRAGVDGVLLEYGHHRGHFLPQRWADHPDPADFLAHLKYRAGLPPDFWDEGLRLWRHGATHWREPQR